MNRNQLVTIAVTVAITVIFREVFTWLVSFAKISATKTATKETARKLFNKDNRAIIYDCCWLVWCVTFLTISIRKTTPVTRWDVVIIVVYVNCVVLAVASLGWDVMKIKLYRTLDQAISSLTSRQQNRLGESSEP